MTEHKTETMSVPEAGKKYFGLSRNGSYDAAARGEIPTIDIGRLKRVPIRLMERMLDGEAVPTLAQRGKRIAKQGKKVA
jgi:hypothetical protein